MPPPASHAAASPLTDSPAAAAVPAQTQSHAEHHTRHTPSPARTTAGRAQKPSHAAAAAGEPCCYHQPQPLLLLNQLLLPSAADQQQQQWRLALGCLSHSHRTHQDIRCPPDSSPDSRHHQKGRRNHHHASLTGPPPQLGCAPAPAAAAAAWVPHQHSQRHLPTCAPCL